MDFDSGEVIGNSITENGINTGLRPLGGVWWVDCLKRGGGGGSFTMNSDILDYRE